MRHPSRGSKSLPRLRPANDAAGPKLSLPAGYWSLWCTQNRKGSSVSHWKPRGVTDWTAKAGSSLGMDGSTFLVLDSEAAAGLRRHAPADRTTALAPADAIAFRVSRRLTFISTEYQA